jgi:hypothetical protein
VLSLEWVSLSRDPKEVTKYLPSKHEAKLKLQYWSEMEEENSMLHKEETIR